MSIFLEILYKSVTFTQKRGIMQISISRYTITSLLLILVAVVVAWLCEVLLGAFPMGFFAFPMNVVLVALWVVVVVELFRARERNVVARYLLSTQATVTALVLAAAGCIVVGLQSKPATQSYLFVLLVLYVMTVLAMVTLRGWRVGGAVRLRFLMSHLGLLLALIAGFWGAADYEELRMVVDDKPRQEAIYIDGRATNLDYTLRLADFDVTYGKSGMPEQYSADIEVDGKGVKLEVNDPYRVGFGQSIYLMNFEQSDANTHIVVQIVHQPWRGVMVVGIVMMILGALLMFFGGAKR